MKVEPAVGKPAIEIKIVTLFLLGKKRGHPGNIFTKLKPLNVDDFLFFIDKDEKLSYNSRFSPRCVLFCLLSINGKVKKKVFT